MTAKAKRNKEGRSGDIKIGLLTSMLIMFAAALAVCISLTVILFSAMGRSVYARVLANSMRTQAERLAEETLSYLDGELTPDSYKFLIRSRDESIVAVSSGQLLCSIG